MDTMDTVPATSKDAVSEGAKNVLQREAVSEIKNFDYSSKSYESLNKSLPELKLENIDEFPPIEKLTTIDKLSSELKNPSTKEAVKAEDYLFIPKMPM